MNVFFEGYRRTDGTAGTRNYVGIVSSVICSSAVVREVADQVKGTVPFVHANGCAQLGDDLKLTKNMLVGVASNPNIHSALFIGLGCETNQVSGLLKTVPKTKPIKGIGIQQLAGGENTIQKGITITEQWVAEAEQQQREQLPLSSLTIGVVSVELDESTATAVTPVVGGVVDKLINAGVKVIVGFSQSLEPAGNVLAERVPDAVERAKLKKSSEGLERLRWADAQVGITTFDEFTEEQTRLAVIESAMTGTEPINTILDYGQAPETEGLHLMKISSNLVESLSKMASAGCGAVIIVSSRGVLTGSVTLPCITVTLENEESSFDELVDYTITRDGTNQDDEVINVLREVCSGKQTKLEELELGEFSIPHLGTTY